MEKMSKRQRITAFYRNKKENMVLLSRSICKDKKIAEDIVQNIFFNLLLNQNFDKIRNLESYMFRCVKFNTYNHLRTVKKQRQILSNIYSCVEKKQSENEKNYDFVKEKIIEDAIEELPVKRRKIFIMKRLQNKNVKEISKESSISTKTVENHITNALKDLKEKLKPIRYD